MAKKRIVATGGWSEPNKRRRVPPEHAPAPTPEPPKKRGILDKAKSMASSYISRGLTNKEAAPETIEMRQMSCHGLNDIDLPPCEFRGESTESGRYMCNECGCGDRRATWLNAKDEDEYTKLHFPSVVCPLNMPGFSNYTAVEKEPEDRTNHYSNFRRKKIIEGYCQSMGIDLVQLSIGESEGE